MGTNCPATDRFRDKKMLIWKPNVQQLKGVETKKMFI